MLFSTWVFLLQRIGCPDWLEIVPASFAAIAARAKTLLAEQQCSVDPPAPRRSGHVAALRQHDSLRTDGVYGRFASHKALLAQAGLLDAALMMSEATLPASSAGAVCARS